MSSHHPRNPTEEENDTLHASEEDMLDADEALEEIPADDDEDHPMDSDPDDNDNEEEQEVEIQLQNDSIAHFDLHKDSIFAIAAHPLDPSIIATGAGDDSAHVFSSAVTNPVLPASYEASPSPQGQGRESLKSIAHLTGHTDSVNALSFSLPKGEFLVTAGMDGRLRAYSTPPLHSLTQGPYSLLGEVQEVEEITWLSPCPHPGYPNTFALGATDGSVWVYTVSHSTQQPFQVVQAYYLHQVPTTAGAWSPAGSLLASVAEDSTLFVYDVFGDAATANISSTSQALISLSSDDARFAVDGGLYSVAFSPTGSFLATGGAGGLIRIVGLPVLSSPGTTTSSTKSKAPKGAATKGQGQGQPGSILASLQAQTDGVETLSFAPAPLTLLAAGSVDGSIALFDSGANFALRRHVRDAHEAEAVVSVSFADNAKGKGYVLTTAGLDGVVRRWDMRGQSNAGAGNGLVGEWKGHRGGGEGGGVLGFVVGGGKVVTAGDDGVALVFDVDKN